MILGDDLKRLAALLFAICLVLSLAGCFGQKESLTLYVPIDGEPKSLDPQIAFGYGAQVIVSNCFEGLLRVGSDKKLDFGVAVGYTVSDDGLTYTFTLNPEAKYYLTSAHKRFLGEDEYDSFDASVKAADFVYAFRRAVSPDTEAPYAGKLFCIKNAVMINSGSLKADKLGVSAPDDHTLVITLAYKDASFLYTLASPIAMPCNRLFFEKTAGKYGLDLGYILCNGPLYVKSWTHGSSVFIRKNKEYTGKAAVKATLVGLMVNDDPESRMNLLSEGTYDCDFIDAKFLSNLADTSSLNLQKLENRVWGLAFNPQTEALKNSDIRTALFSTVKASLFKATAFTAGTAKSLVPRGCFIGDTPYLNLADVKPPVYSKSDAVLYWKKGLRELKTAKIGVTVICTSDFRASVDKIVQHWQSVLGVALSVKISEVSDIELLRAFNDGDYEIIFAPLQSDATFAADYIEDLCVNSLPVNSSELDSLIKLMKKQTDTQKKADAIERIEAYLYNQSVFYPIFNGFTYFAVCKKTQGFYYYASKNSLCLYTGERYEE